MSSRGHVCCCECVHVGCVQRCGCMTGDREGSRCLLVLLCVSVWLLCHRRAHHPKRQMGGVLSRVPWEAYVRSRWGERRALFVCVCVGPPSFHSMSRMKAVHCSVFLSILYFPLFFMGSLSPALAFVLLPDAGKHTHTHAEQITCPCSLQPGPCWLGLLKRSDD